jgi:hypothetical protein
VTYTLPDSVRALPTDPRTLTYALLTVEQEIDAERAAQGGGTAATTRELVKRSVVAVDGRAIDWAGTDPEWYDRASPKVREQATRGFIRVNRTSGKEDADFLASEAVES